MSTPLPHLRVIEACDDLPGAYCARQFALWGADVVVTDRPVEAAWRESNARLVVVSVTPYGLSGPYAELEGTQLTTEAASGFLSTNGLPGEPPLSGPANILPYFAGVHAFVAALAALRARESTGRGQLVEVSRTESLAHIVNVIRVQVTGQLPRRRGHPGTGIRTYESADGYVALNPIQQWAQLPDVLGLHDIELPPPPEPTGDAARDGDVARALLREHMPAITQRLRELPGDVVFLGLQGAERARVNAPRDLVFDQHLLERRFYARLEHPDLGTLPLAGPAAVTTVMRPEAPRPAPERASDTPAWTDRPVPSTGSRDPRTPPLEGLRVVDLTHAWIGPYATQLLADLGATVLKVESHRRPDVWRAWSPNRRTRRRRGAHPANSNPNFNSVNRNKLDLTLDLKTERGRELFLELVKTADVVAENYRPGVVESLGLGYDDLRTLKPDLVMVSFCGFGRTGPYSTFRTNGAAIEALAGWDWLHGYADGPPIMLPFYPADAIVGVQMAALILLALEHRDRTGRGQWIDGSMLEGAAGYIGEHLMLAALGVSTQRNGNRHPAMAPHGTFPCAGEDRWVAIAVRDDADWQGLVRVLPGLAGERFASTAGRLSHADELERRLAALTGAWDREDLARVLQAERVPAMPVRTLDEILADPHLRARGWFEPLTHPDLGTHDYPAPPFRFCDATTVCERPPARLGEDSRRILAVELGLDDREIEALFAAGVTGEMFGDEPVEAQRS